MTLHCSSSFVSGWQATAAGLLAALALLPSPAAAQDALATAFSVLHSFDVPEGTNPSSGLLQDPAGNFLGTAPGGGTAGGSGAGTVYSMDSLGALTPLQQFPSADRKSGEQPRAGLIRASDGNFYGVNSFGGFQNGSGGSGTVFRLTPANEYAVLYTFPTLNPVTGSVPLGELVQGRDGRLYGTTSQGGVNGGGTAFAISLSGAFEVLHQFNAFSGDGAGPQAALIVGSDGNLYGTTAGGGATGGGTVFRMTPAGDVTILHSFLSANEGSFPATPLLQYGRDLYGTCRERGLNGLGWGTVFKLGASGKFTVLHAFRQDGIDGRVPWSGLTRAGSALFGVTNAGGSANSGTVYRITPAGSLTIVLSFGSAVTDAKSPQSRLLLARDGKFYGTTSRGGTNDRGTVYRLSR